ncbi:MAG TPA: hypothetical protein VIN60_09660 [Anaerolineales bacterium]
MQRVSFGQELSFPEKCLDFRICPRKHQSVIDPGSIDAELQGGPLNRESQIFDQDLECLAFIHDIHILPVYVLDQRVEQKSFIVALSVADQDRHFGETGHLRRAPSAFTSDQGIPAFHSSLDNQRLDHAAFANGRCQFLQFFFVECFSWLSRIRIDLYDSRRGNFHMHLPF